MVKIFYAIIGIGWLQLFGALGFGLYGMLCTTSYDSWQERLGLRLFFSCMATLGVATIIFVGHVIFGW